MNSDYNDQSEDSDQQHTEIDLVAPALPTYIQLSVSQPLAEQLLMTLDRHDTSTSSYKNSVTSDRPPTNLSIKNTDKENKTTNYLQILDMKFNKKGKSKT